MNTNRGSNPLPTHSLKDSLILAGNGHNYQRDVILSLTLQTFFLTLLVSNRQLAASYQLNLGGIAGSFIFA